MMCNIPYYEASIYVIHVLLHTLAEGLYTINNATFIYIYTTYNVYSLLLHMNMYMYVLKY